jgi:glycosyltransferase involved in cell wall biosynthesis
MLEAWKAAENPIPLKVVGQGPLTGLVTAAAHAGGNVEYLGGRQLPEVLDLMRGAEFLVFPSEWYETMGRTIMEAFAVGTPVVASNLGPMATMVVPEKTGLLFTQGSVAELRGRIEWCARNPDQVRAWRQNARAAFEASYTGAANVRQLLAIYAKAQQDRRSTVARESAGL